VRRRRRRLKINPSSDEPDPIEEAPIEPSVGSSSVEPAPIPGAAAVDAVDAVEMAPIPGAADEGAADDAARNEGAAGRKLRKSASLRKARTEISNRWKGIPRDLIDGYRLEAVMGEGSMGAVFRAEQLSLRRSVAGKLLTPRRALDKRHLQRFLREARAVAKLNHPNIVSGIDVGESRGFRYFVMEFIEGPTLLQLLEERGPMDGLAATKVMLQIARALDHANRNGLVHRDVKPANIVITRRQGQAKLCDLGLAKEVGDDGSETLEGKAIGTPYYISPEQARGQADIDIRSDLYSLGASYYHAVTGEVAFEGPTPAVVMAKHLTEPRPDASALRRDLPAGISEIIMKLMAQDRAERYQTPAEVLPDLQAVLDGTYESVKPQIRARRRRRRRFR